MYKELLYNFRDTVKETSTISSQLPHPNPTPKLTSFPSVSRPGGPAPPQSNPSPSALLCPPNLLLVISVTSPLLLATTPQHNRVLSLFCLRLSLDFKTSFSFFSSSIVTKLLKELCTRSNTDPQWIFVGFNKHTSTGWMHILLLSIASFPPSYAIPRCQAHCIHSDYSKMCIWACLPTA